MALTFPILLWIRYLVSTFQARDNAAYIFLSFSAKVPSCPKKRKVKMYSEYLNKGQVQYYNDRKYSNHSMFGNSRHGLNTRLKISGI